METQIKIQKRWTVVSRIAQVAIMLALIRCIGESIRFYIQAETFESISKLKPFLFGSFICAISVFVMFLFSFYNLRKLIIAVSALTIAILLYIKYMYL